jgi:hypothetical protein
MNIPSKPNGKNTKEKIFLLLDDYRFFIYSLLP